MEELFNPEFLAKYGESIISIIDKQCNADIFFIVEIDGKEYSIPKDMYIKACKEVFENK
jgi:hypothetical protein